MQQTTAAPTYDDMPRHYGGITIVGRRTIEGGYTINVFTGPIREHDLCIGTMDADLADLAYRTIAEGGEQRVQPAGIREALTDALTWRLHEVQRRHDTPSRELIGEINRILDRFDTPADRAALAQLAEDITRGNALRDLADHGTPNQVQPLKGGAATDISDPVDRAVAIACASPDGTVSRGGQPGQAPLNVLIAAARPGRGLLTLIYKPGTRVVTGAAVTARGRRHHTK